ncbi:MAG: PIN domain-containing protein [Acetobacteraceae bacterium]|nr:PIN domain-containing protein [Acetobacteraceae bacterium]
MSGESFTLDTNILVYSIDSSAGLRHALAREIVDESVGRNCRLTLQAVSEFYASVTRKRVIARREAAAQAEDFLLLFPTSASSPMAVRNALAISVAGRASYWDALLVASAAEAGCTAILTEDLKGGALLSGVRIINPFAGNRLGPEVSALFGR